MKNFYLLMFLTMLATPLLSQEEELIPGAVVGSCVEPDSNLITIYFDYSKNCPQADPSGALAGAEVLGFHSGINNWSTIIAFDAETASTMTNIGNGIYMLKLNTMDYYGSSLADIEDVHFLMRSHDPSDSWDATCTDDKGGGGFGGDEPCNNFVLTIVNLPICSEVEAETSVSLFGPTTAANSCIDTTNNTIQVDFDLSLNCPEADPNNLLAGATELGFHSGANDWESQVDWDDDGALRAVNNGNDIFSLTVDPEAYYGIPLADMNNIVMVMNNGAADPDNAWNVTGRDERDGGFGGAEDCSDLVLSLSEIGICPVVVEVVSSEAVIEVFGELATCMDPNRGKVRISFDLSKNCPEADPDNVLSGVDALGFHSGANDWTHQVAWDADNALQATNDGNDIFTVTIDVMDYYGIPFDSLQNIRFILNNGVSDPENAWAVVGRDHRDGDDGFGNIVDCTDLILDISELEECELPDFLTSIELTSGLANSCVDAESGRIRIDWDRNQNCVAADSTNALGDTIAFHSGVNTWANQVPWDDENVMKPVNDGNGLYSMIIDVQEYYNISLDSVSEVNFLFNNGVVSPDDPWTVTGKATKEGGGFGGDEPCDNFLLVISELETCDLGEKLSSQELFSGLAETCVDTESGKVRIDFDRNQNCAEADPNNMLGDTIVLHSGVNTWMNQVAWDAENSAKPSNDGNGLYRTIIDIQEYYGLPIDSVTEINFLYNNGVANPASPWDITGKATTGDGGFGGDEPCGNFLIVLSEAPACDLSESLSSAELFSGLAESCVDMENGKVRIDFDRNQNCAEADPGDMLGDTIVLHSGINNWMNQVAWDAENSAKPSNDGSGLYRTVIDIQEYYGTSLDSVTEINFLYNNGVANIGAPWDNTGKATTGMGGFGGDELCDNFRLVISEAPTCDLSVRQSSMALVSGLANSCVDPDAGLIRLDFDMSQNCSEADPDGLLLGAAQIGFHSGINNWMNQVAFDAENAMAATNDGNDLFTVIIDAQAYYGIPLSEITEINFLYNNRFGGDGVDVWANTGKDETGMGGFGGDELCDNFLFLPATAPTCALTNTVDITLESSLKVIPNPFSEEVLIRFDNPSNKEYTLTLHDLSGKLVRSMSGLRGTEVRVERRELVSGMYFAHLRDAQGHFATAKLVVK